jgi:hypothetical protein
MNSCLRAGKLVRIQNGELRWMRLMCLLAVADEEDSGSEDGSQAGGGRGGDEEDVDEDDGEETAVSVDMSQASDSRLI